MPLAADLLPIPTDSRFIAAVALTAATLFSVGAARSFVTGLSPFRSGLELLLVGALAAVTAYLIGRGEEQPRRRGDPLGGAGAPFACRQGDRDRIARIRATRARRRLAGGLLDAGVFDTPAELGGDMALVIPWFVLGYALYAVAYAVAGALASSQQNAETAGQPVTYALIAVYFAGYATLSSNAEGPLASLLTVFPLTRRSCSPPAAPSSACRSGSTRSRSCSSS